MLHLCLSIALIQNGGNALAKRLSTVIPTFEGIVMAFSPVNSPIWGQSFSSSTNQTI
eukprot:UN22551